MGREEGGYCTCIHVHAQVSIVSVPCAGNSPLHHSSRKSSSHSESTPLSSPSSLLAVGPQAVNPFAINYDSGNCDHWQSGSASSSGGQSPLLINASSAVSLSGRENGINRITDDVRKTILVYPQGGELKNNLHIDPPGPPDPNSDVPSPLSPKGLQFRHRPFPLSSSSLQSPIPRSVSTTTNSATPTPSRNTPLPISKSALQHDKQLSPFNSDLAHTHSHGHAHTHPHSHANTHRQVHRLHSYLSTSTISSGGHRLQQKPDPGSTDTKSFSSRLIHSPISKLSVSTSVEEYHCTGVNSSALEGRSREGGREGRSFGDLKVRVRRKRRSSEASLDGREESLMESDSSLPESCDEGIEMVTTASTKQA